MEKFILTKRVYELKAGEIFWFSGSWREVIRVYGGVLYYKMVTEDYHSTHQKNDTLMAGSKMLVQIKENSDGK